MEIFIENFFNVLQAVHENIEKLLENLPQEALDWPPGQAMNSLSVIAIHVAGSERYWIGDVIGRDPSHRDREAEFRVQGMDADSIRNRLREVYKHTHATLAPLALDQLSSLRVSPRDGREYTIGWCMQHILQHTALHLGHMEVTRQLWDQHQ